MTANSVELTEALSMLNVSGDPKHIKYADLAGSYYSKSFSTHHFSEEDDYMPEGSFEKIAPGSRVVMKKPDPTRPSAYKPKTNEAGMSRHWGTLGYNYQDAYGRQGKVEYIYIKGAYINLTARTGRDGRAISDYGKTYVQVGLGRNVMVQLLTKLSESSDGEYALKVSGSYSEEDSLFYTNMNCTLSEPNGTHVPVRPILTDRAPEDIEQSSWSEAVEAFNAETRSLADICQGKAPGFYRANICVRVTTSDLIPEGTLASLLADPFYTVKFSLSAVKITSLPLKEEFAGVGIVQVAQVDVNEMDD